MVLLKKELEAQGGEACPFGEASIGPKTCRSALISMVMFRSYSGLLHMSNIIILKEIRYKMISENGCWLEERFSAMLRTPG